AATAEPERPVEELDLLSPEERHQLQVEWNDSDRRLASEGTLHGLVAARARLKPEATALVHGRESLSYGELDWRSDMLADHLAARLSQWRAGAEPRIGVCLSRTLDLPVAVLAVLKAGAAYVPLDPAYPQERLAFLMADSDLAAVITSADLGSELPGPGVPRILLEEMPAPAGNGAGELPEVSPDRLAYVIYTSGSTGRPKGVAIEHRNAVTLVRWAREVFSDEELEGVLAATSLSFDLSVWELFVPLAWGGRVILADNALALPSLPAKEQVRLINTVPSALAELVRQKAVPKGVRTVNLAGEALPEGLVRDVLAGAEAGRRRVLNLYGPSEDTTYSTWAQVDGSEKPLIGGPLAHTQAYVTDSGLGLQPLG
ncbi:MAG: AMP-binding protein, partial [Acidobacteria bacterium]|nr:AMP-binding protein [Acidobacteriota bacterium]